MDLLSGYYQIPLNKASRERCCFRLGPNSVWRLCKLAMGAAPSAAIFSEILSDVLHELLYTQGVYSYLDDVFVVSHTVQEHAHRLSMIFQKMRNAGLYFSTKKCCFAHPQIDCLGVLICKQSHRPNPERYRAFNPLVEVTTPKGARRLLGFLSYLRKYVKNFAQKALPITQAANAAPRGFRWTPEMRNAAVNIFEEIKQASLFHFDPTLKTKLEVDASKLGISGALYQKFDVGSQPKQSKHTPFSYSKA
ncbi:Transposon Tf2-9 polyprotein [Frankliniella fusca]|uniref:Transposon Tf2-9 polyprotein n=1 Tax=Frankliniella fusca TaxID=407009 RepID=A0AAE1I000_9NEOP|nr:Transposon Tf2-9 polyprotein [Frankliniella fusca]